MTKQLPAYELVVRWTVQDVCNWLREAKLSDFISYFSEIDGKRLVNLSESDFLKMPGISIKKRKNILVCVETMREKYKKGVTKKQSNIQPSIPPARDYRHHYLPPADQDNEDDIGWSDNEFDDEFDPDKEEIYEVPEEDSYIDAVEEPEPVKPPRKTDFSKKNIPPPPLPNPLKMKPPLPPIPFGQKPKLDLRVGFPPKPKLPDAHNESQKGYEIPPLVSRKIPLAPPPRSDDDDDYEEPTVVEKIATPPIPPVKIKSPKPLKRLPKMLPELPKQEEEYYIVPEDENFVNNKQSYVSDDEEYEIPDDKDLPPLPPNKRLHGPSVVNVSQPKNTTATGSKPSRFPKKKLDIPDCPTPPPPPRPSNSGINQVVDRPKLDVHKRNIPSIPVTSPQRKKEEPAPDPRITHTLLNDLDNYLWFHGDAARKDIEAKLLNICQNGIYAVRKSLNAGKDCPYVLTVYHNKIYHLPIRYRDDNKYALGRKKPNEPAFSTVVELIEHFSTETLVLADNNFAILTLPLQK